MTRDRENSPENDLLEGERKIQNSIKWTPKITKFKHKFLGTKRSFSRKNLLKKINGSSRTTQKKSPMGQLRRKHRDHTACLPLRSFPTHPDTVSVTLSLRTQF
jgi:hypothetical protein